VLTKVTVVIIVH